MGEYGAFYDYVLDNLEWNHSGVLSNVNRLNPRYEYEWIERYNALRELAQYADYSLTAYRAIEWWSWHVENKKYSWLKVMEILASIIIADIQKPTHCYNRYGEMIGAKNGS